MTKYDPRSARIAALPLVLGLAACAPGAAAGPQLLTPGWVPPPGQRCELSDSPRQLPSVDQVVDSAALARDLAGAPGGGSGLFTVRFDTLGMADTVRLAGGAVPAGTQAAWHGAVTRRMRERSPLPVPVRRGRPQSWSALLQVEGGASPRMRLGRSEECAPVLTNGFAVQGFAQQAFARQIRNNPMRQRPSQVMMDFVVDSTGAVRGARVHTSSGIPDMDEIARQAVEQGRFLPALLNRQAVGTKVRMPFAFTVNPPNRPSSIRP